MTDTTNLSSEQLSLLGITLLSVQRLENALYQAIRVLCKQDSSNDIRAIGNVTPEQFLKGTSAELKPTLQILHEAFGESLPLSTTELNEFLYKRNLISLGFWQATTTKMERSEKLANPTLFLQELVTQCEIWLAKIESNK